VLVAFAGWMAIGSVPASAAGGGASIVAVEGQQLESVVVDSLGTCDAPRTNITIDWGDTATSAGALVLGSGGSCTITGSHTYLDEGAYDTSVSYTSTANRARVSDAGRAVVADAPVTAGSVNNFTVPAGSELTGVVANWSDAAPEPLSSYSAAIDWGDGTSGVGLINNGTVSGSHAYLNGGRFTITVAFHDEGGASATAHEQAVVTGCPTAGPSFPAPPFTPTATALNARFVQAIYHDILGRSPAASEVAAATNALSLGATRSQIALTLLDSNERRAHLVAFDEQAYLHRAPSPTEANAFVSALASGSSDEALIAHILASPEYFASRGHDSTDGFLSAMYCDALSRPIDQIAQNNGEAALGSGASRTVIASSVLGSSEYRTLLIRGFYLRYLRRAATSSDLATWTAFMHNGGSDEQVIAAIVSSAEYFSRFNPAIAFRTELVVTGNTLRTTLTRDAELTLTVLRVLPPRGHAAAVLVTRPRTQLVGAVNFGLRHKGRVTLHWNRKVHNRRLARGGYVLILKAFARHKPYKTGHKPYKTRKLIGISDPVRLRIR
jgi:hypothetical protein